MSEVQVGGHIDGKYEVLGRVGSGGMGEVYRVRHVHLDEVRVIKVMRTDLVHSTEAIDRFSNEARLATRVKHHNVATLHDFSRLPDGSFYMVWEFIEGQDVEGWLEGRGRFPLQIALDLARQVLAGLEAIHEKGIVHRDVSPDNLMITTDPRGRLGVKIIDLGLADQVTAMGERSSQVGGKLNYCSPEHVGLIEGVRPDHVSDLYSFAIVLYRMLTGVLPFARAETVNDLTQRRAATPRALSLESVHSLMQIALAFDRSRRFQTASEFRRALDDLSRSIEDQQQSARTLEGRARLDEAATALRGNRLEEAERHLSALETRHPGLDGLAALRERLDSMTSGRRQVQLMQMREMVEQYLASKQRALARLSLESLVELDPNYRDRDALEARVVALEEAETLAGRVAALIGQAEQKLAAGDLVSVRALHAQLSELDQKAATRVLDMLEERDRDTAQGQAVDQTRATIERLLEDDQLDQASEVIDELDRLGMSRVTGDVYRRRLGQLKQSKQNQERAAHLRSSYEQLMAAARWNEARGVVQELNELDPEDDSLTSLLTRVEESYDAARRQEGLSEGVSTLTSLLDAGRLEEARMAWTVLLRMSGGQHPLRGHFEARLRELEAGRD